MNVKKEIVDAIQVMVDAAIKKTCPVITFGIVTNVGQKNHCTVQINNIGYEIKYYGETAPSVNQKYPVFMPFNKMPLAFIISGGTGSGGGTDDYNQLSNRPSINNVILSGNQTASQLGLFDGNYNNLTNKPTIPNKTSQLTNDSGFITDANVPDPTTTTPKMDGTANVGVESKYARGDHVHPVDTSRQAALSTAQLNAVNSGITSSKVSTYDGYSSQISSKYTKPSGGIPSSDMTTAVQTSLGKADTAIQSSDLATVATTGSYNDLSNKPTIPSASSVVPKIDGTGTIGTSTNYARADHIHPTDTSRQEALNTSQLSAVNSGITSSKVSTYDGYATGKENSISSGTTSQYWRGDKTWQTLNKSAVGLGNVDNVKQYSANNPPPYPVTSVNGQTGDVTVPTYTLPKASTSTLGGIRVGDNLTIDSNGVLSAVNGASDTEVLIFYHSDGAVTCDKTPTEAFNILASGKYLLVLIKEQGVDYYEYLDELICADNKIAFSTLATNWLNDGFILSSTIGTDYRRRMVSGDRTTNVWSYVITPVFKLPIATATDLGAIKVGNGLNIDSSTGVLSVDALGGVTSVNNKQGAITLTTKSVGSASGWNAGSKITLGTAIKADDITAWSAGTLPTLGDDIAVKSVKSFSAGSAPTLGTAISADDITAWSAGTLPTLGTAIPADDITAWNAGSLPTLGTAISADDITAWSAGELPTLGTNISADDITAWSAGSAPSLTITSTACDDITGWTSNTPTGFTIENGTLKLTAGSAASLSYTARNIGSASGWNAGSVPSLSYTSRSIPNVTGVGTLPSLSYTSRSIPNVTGVGTLPSLSYTAKSIPNVTGVGTLPSLSYTAKSIPNVTSVGSAPSLTTEDIDIPNITDVGTLPSLSYTEKTIPNVTGTGTLPSLTITSTTVGDGNVSNT